MNDFNIGCRTVGDEFPVFIIAELSANHEQKLQLARDTLKAMKEAGANAVKLQTYKPETMTLDSDKPWFQTRKEGPWAGQTLYDLYRKACTPWEWHRELQDLARQLDMEFFSTPFDPTAVDFLESLNVPAYKIASQEITDIPLLKRVAGCGKPMILSTGIAGYDDIRLAMDTCLEAGNKEIALLKCTSAYPTPYEEVNLLALKKMKEEFRVITGLSDHTPGFTIPIASVALGARIIEKHFILDKKGAGLDRDFSLDPAEFKRMVNAVRQVEKALGNGEIRLTEAMQRARKMSRSLFAVKDIPKGSPFTLDNVRVIRPGMGLHPKRLDEILGKKAREDIEKGTPLDDSLIG